MSGAPDTVGKLVDRFERNREAYRSGRYNETQLRVELIDPFFLALGWDVHNAAGYAEAYKDVVHKDAPEHFTLSTLQKAHEARYRKALVDVISTVKHVADEQQPLLTAEERVRRAFEAVTPGRTFTTEQEQWLERIRSHLIANLTIDRDDFDYVPVLQQAGGWGRASNVFGGQLAEVIGQLNQAVAA